MGAMFANVDPERHAPGVRFSDEERIANIKREIEQMNERNALKPKPRIKKKKKPIPYTYRYLRGQAWVNGELRMTKEQ